MQSGIDTNVMPEILSIVMKKSTIKEMVHSALQDLIIDTRKGVSFQAIKKHIESYGTDVDKINYFIKKCIKNGVEEGTILQTRGVGATGSFRLAPEEVVEKKKILRKPVKIDKKKAEQMKKKTELSKKKVTKKIGKKTEDKNINMKKTVSPIKKPKVEKKSIKTKETIKTTKVKEVAKKGKITKRGKVPKKGKKGKVSINKKK